MRSGTAHPHTLLGPPASVRSRTRRLNARARGFASTNLPGRKGARLPPPLQTQVGLTRRTVLAGGLSPGLFPYQAGAGSGPLKALGAPVHA